MKPHEETPSLLFRIKNCAKREPIALIFFITLIISLFAHLSFRNDHFQEADSAGTYQMIYEFPSSALRTTALFYPEGHIFSTSTAQKILGIPFVHSIRTKHLSSLSDEFIIDQLTKTSLTGAMRYAMIQVIAATPLPWTIQTFFALPLGSTYSAGTGLAYGLITGPSTSYEDFMSRTLALTTVLFHLSILLLFLTNKQIGVRPFGNATISMIALFSISMYTTGMSTSSAVWNLVTEFFWLWQLARLSGKPGLNKRISAITAILVFFNYLIFFFWAAYMLVRLVNDRVSAKKSVRAFWSWILGMIREQKIAIIAVAACGFLFYQSGQGFRGSTALADLPSHTYYILLNFTSWHTQSHTLNIIQFLFSLALAMSVVAFFFIKKDSAAQNQNTALVRQVLMGITVIYIIAVLLGILSYIPTRHMLFLAPILYIGAAGGLRHLKNHFESHFKQWHASVLIASFAILGFCAITVRQADARDLNARLIVNPVISTYGIYDSAYDLYYFFQDQGLAVDFVNPKNFEAGKTYMYVSHSEPFAKAYGEWITKYDISADIIWNEEIPQQVYFIAHNPDFEKLRYSRPNSLYQAAFKVNFIQAKH